MTDKMNYDDNNNKKGCLPARRHEGNLARKLRLLRTLRQDSMNKSLNMSIASFSESSLMDFQSPRTAIDSSSNNNNNNNNKKGGLPATRQEGDLARKLRELRTLRQESMNKSMNMSTASFSESSLMDFQSPTAVMDFQSPKTVTRGSIRDLGKTIDAPPFLLSPTKTKMECSLNSSSTSLSFEQIFSTDGDDDDEVDEFLGSVVAYSTCLP